MRNQVLTPPPRRIPQAKSVAQWFEETRQGSKPRSSKPLRWNRFNVVGIKHHMENFEAADLMQGDVLVLQPEPSNRFDPNAIRVLKDSQPIGYVPADRCRAMLAFMLDYRVEVVVNACGPTHCQVNVRLYRKD